jgi:protein-tyrosine phosphatase
MERMAASNGDPFRVVFVCTGNICRSPMADVVFRGFADAAGLGGRVASTSAGTGDWHVGERADQRTLDALERAGYDGTRHRARQFTHADFAHSDLVVALDRSHERILRGWARTESDSDKIALLLSFDPAARSLDVPDPYYAGPGMFDEVLGMIESASRALFRQLEPAIRPAK